MLPKHFAILITLVVTLTAFCTPALAQMSPDYMQGMSPYGMQGYGMQGMNPYGAQDTSSSSGLPSTEALRTQTLSGIDVNRGLEYVPPYEARYRRAVVDNCVMFHKKMSSGRLQFGRHMESQYFNTKYWEPVYYEGNQYWKVKGGVRKSDAMQDFISANGGRYKLDCAGAINVILLKSKLDTVGESNFDRHVPTLMVRGWTTYTTKNGNLTEYKTLEKWAGNEYSGGSPYGLLAGDYVYFKNDPMLEGTPEQGENAIYMGMDSWGRPVFFGLNIGMSRGTANQYGVLTSERGTIDPDKLLELMS